MNLLDGVLIDCLQFVVDQLQSDEKLHNHEHGLVGAAIVTKEYPTVYGVSTHVTKEKCRHAERSAIDRFHRQYGTIPEDAILVTTLSPCFEPMPDRLGASCCDLIRQNNIKTVYTGLDDWTQEKYEPDHNHYAHESFKLLKTSNKKIKNICIKLLKIIDKSQQILPDNLT